MQNGHLNPEAGVQVKSLHEVGVQLRQIAGYGPERGVARDRSHIGNHFLDHRRKPRYYTAENNQYEQYRQNRKKPVRSPMALDADFRKHHFKGLCDEGDHSCKQHINHDAAELPEQ